MKQVSLEWNNIIGQEYFGAKLCQEQDKTCYYTGWMIPSVLLNSISRLGQNIHCISVEWLYVCRWLAVCYYDIGRCMAIILIWLARVVTPSQNNIDNRWQVRVSQGTDFWCQVHCQ